MRVPPLLSSVLLHAMLLAALLAAVGLRTVWLRPPESRSVEIEVPAGSARNKSENASSAVRPRTEKVVATEETEKKSKEETAASPSSSSIGEARKNPVPQTMEAASGAGSGEIPSGIDHPDALRIRARIRENLRYPLALQRRGIQGKTKVKLTLAPDGKLEQVSVQESSGSEDLDRLAVEAVQKSAPFGPSESRVTLLLPVEFRIR